MLENESEESQVDIPIIGKVGKLAGKIDKKALAGAVGIMLLSWAALPIVYYLIVRKNGKTKKSKNISQKESSS